MQTLKELMEKFECNIDIAKKLLALHDVGFAQGTMGLYPQGDFADSLQWQSEVGLEVQKLEMGLDITGNDIYEIYETGHKMGLEKYEEAKGYQDDNL